MRARSIKPGFFKNEDIAECSPFARLLFPGLWMLADREGKLEYRPKRIKAEVFPFDNVDVAALVSELEARGLVKTYFVGGCEYLWIIKFADHQRPHQNEQPSTIPNYSNVDEALVTKVQSTCNQGNKRFALDTSSLTPSSLTASNLDAFEDKGSSGAADAAPCARAPKRPDCPYQEILALYHELLPQLPTVQNFTANAKATMRARWNESAETQSLTYWRRVFVTVAASDFLMGKVKDFRCPGLLWIIGPKNFAKIVNGAYSNHGPRTGSSLTDGNLRACQDFLESRKVQQ